MYIRPESWKYSDDESYYAGSLNSLTATASSLPGSGRTLGRLYSRVGRRIENCVSALALRMGCGPYATAVKIRRLAECRLDCSNLYRLDRKLQRQRRRLARYIGYVLIIMDKQ